jgi:histidinol-phosphate aminotransferase
MGIAQYANQFVCDLHAYQPGKPIEDTAHELGLEPSSIIKLASNENPLGPSPLAREAMVAAIDKAHIYPDGGGLKLRGAIAERFDLDLEHVVLGNGSNEIIELLCHSFLRPGASLIAAEHAFVVYKLMASLFGADYVEVPDPGFVHDLDAMAEAITDDTRLVFIANPNNPTGTMVDQEAIDRFMDRVPEHVVVCFDEAYHEFLESAPDTLKFVRAGRNVCVLRTCSKIHGLAAVRIGYGLASKGVAAVLQKARQPFNANAVAQAGALAALDDVQHAERTRRLNDESLQTFEGTFKRWGLRFVPSFANFVLVEVGDGDAVFDAMLRQGIIVRAMRSYKLPSWIRLSTGTAEQNERALTALEETLQKIEILA